MSDTIRLVPDENWDNVKTLVGIPREINLPTCPRAKLYLEDDGRILVWRTWRTWRNRCERYTRYDSWETAEKAVIKWAKTRARKIEKDNAEHLKSTGGYMSKEIMQYIESKEAI